MHIYMRMYMHTRTHTHTNSRPHTLTPSGNYAGMYMSFKNVFVRHNDLKRHFYVE